VGKPFRLPEADARAVLQRLDVRLISPAEQPRWEQEVSEHHYLKNATLVGEHLRYVATFQGQWLACLGWSAPARHLKPREQWVGWGQEQLRRRRHLLANNARYCILADRHGRRHPWRAVLGIIVLAKLAGTHMGQRHIAELARHPTKPQRRALGCLRDQTEPSGYRVPAESTYQRALARLDFAALEPLLLAWQKAALGPDADALIAIDGKAMRRTDGRSLVAAIGQPSQQVHGAVAMDKHDSEIIAVRALLAKTECAGRLVTLDAIHATTCSAAARPNG